MPNPLVSVIIPCYNQGLFIDETIQSVLEQTYENIEIIIVNDGSDDKITTTILANYHNDANKVVLPVAHKGVSAARNHGIVNCNGEYVLPLDADDLIAPTFIQKAVNVLQSSPKIDLVYCRASYFGDREGEMELGAFDLKETLLRNQIFNTALLRKNKVISVNGYDESFLIGWEDWDFYLRYITANSQVHKIDEILFYYRIKKESRNESLHGQKLKKVEQQLFKKHIDLYLKYHEYPVSLIRNDQSNINAIVELKSVIRSINNSFSFRLGSSLSFPIRLIYSLLFSWKK